MTPVTLRAFIHEYRLASPVGVDRADPHSDIPLTMQAYGLRGTPSSVLIGRDGTVLHSVFGVGEDLAIGARIAMALAQPMPAVKGTTSAEGCADGVCAAPAAASQSE